MSAEAATSLIVSIGFGIFINLLWIVDSKTYAEVGSQAISYTTGVPAMVGAMMLLTGKWSKPGVYTVEEFDPDPYMDALNQWGLPWQIDENPALVD